MPSDAFDQAAKDSKNLKAKPSNDELLELYSLFKVANGEDISKVAKPGMFDLKGKAKYEAWQAKVNEGLTAEDAEKLYIDKVEELKSKYGVKETE